MKKINWNKPHTITYDPPLKYKPGKSKLFVEETPRIIIAYCLGMVVGAVVMFFAMSLVLNLT